MTTATVSLLLFLALSLLMLLPWWTVIKMAEWRLTHRSPADQARAYFWLLVAPIGGLFGLLLITFGPWDADFCERLHQTCLNHIRALHLPGPLVALLGLLVTGVAIRFLRLVRPTRLEVEMKAVSPEQRAKWERVVTRLKEVAKMQIPDLVIATETHGVCQVRGVFSPRVVVSQDLLDGLTDYELTGAIAHELAHIRRGDLLLGYLMAACHHVLFYLPISRYCYLRWKEAREFACDDQAVAWTGKPLALASALVKAARGLQDQRYHLSACHLVTARTSLEVRVERLLRQADGQITIPTTKSYMAPALIAVLVAMAWLGGWDYTTWHHQLEQLGVRLLWLFGVIG